LRERGDLVCLQTGVLEYPRRSRSGRAIEFLRRLRTSRRLKGGWGEVPVTDEIGFRHMTTLDQGDNPESRVEVLVNGESVAEGLMQETVSPGTGSMRALLGALGSRRDAFYSTVVFRASVMSLIAASSDSLTS
jgi:hypothetical protein